MQYAPTISEFPVIHCFFLVPQRAQGLISSLCICIHAAVSFVLLCVCVCATLWLLGQVGPLNVAGGLPHSHGLGGDFVRLPSLRSHPSWLGCVPGLKGVGQGRVRCLPPTFPATHHPGLAALVLLLFWPSGLDPGLMGPPWDPWAVLGTLCAHLACAVAALHPSTCGRAWSVRLRERNEIVVSP